MALVLSSASSSSSSSLSVALSSLSASFSSFSSLSSFSAFSSSFSSSSSSSLSSSSTLSVSLLSSSFSSTAEAGVSTAFLGFSLLRDFSPSSLDFFSFFSGSASGGSFLFFSSACAKPCSTSKVDNAFSAASEAVFAFSAACNFMRCAEAASWYSESFTSAASRAFEASLFASAASLAARLASSSFALAFSSRSLALELLEFEVFSA
mmetsp:Transcript_68709/g.108250  ORF Transcript_68709/g.108250 Transcript_68709/m.108250 type:complete len:207 (-) Transcript_68709:601-1221(-)